MMIHRLLIASLAALALVQLPAPASASEVVKLARMVLTGKRTNTESTRDAAPSSNEKTAPSTSAPSTDSGAGAASDLGGGSHGGSGHVFLRPF